MGRKGKFVPIRALSQTIERLLAGAQNGIALEKLFKQFSKKFPNETPNRFFDAVSIVIQKGQYVLDSEADRLVPRPYRGVVIFRPGFEPLVIIEEEKRKEPLSFSSAFCALPGDVLEASSIDGANASQTLFSIKIPMIAPTITICTFLTLTSAFKQFDVNLALTNGTGSVASFMGSYLTNGTEMLALNIYSTAVINNEYAFGEAKAVLFFIILAVVSIIQVRISNKREVEL